MIGEGIFLEWDKYANYFYGTYLKNVEDMANSRLFKGVILDLTPKGCQQVKEIMPSSIIIALLPDDPAWLIKRLLSRGTQSEKEIRARTKLLGGYLEMINQIGFCEKVYVGFSPDSWDSTFDAIEKIIRG
jgi:guanylate kinase